MKWFHKHIWSKWWEDVALFGNGFGQKHQQAVRVRKCKECLKHQVRRLGK